MENEERLIQYEQLCASQHEEIERARKRYEDVISELPALRAQNEALQTACAEKDLRIKELNDWTNILQADIDKKNAWRKKLGPIYFAAKKLKHLYKKITA